MQKILIYLLESGTSKCEVIAVRDDMDYAALHCAVVQNSPQVLQQLLPFAALWGSRWKLTENSKDTGLETWKTDCSTSPVDPVFKKQATTQRLL
ncbi:hypothetical protein FHG87_018263 [Trinorchestia longiramus]|nr:hypothetical protein FHG87_018263 [Trinorchestia longiramus]